MKIIKKGNPKGKATRKTCPDCKTIFEYYDKDVKSYTDYGGYTDTYVQCPVCKVSLYVKS
jgi:hypothetical protein